MLPPQHLLVAVAVAVAALCLCPTISPHQLPASDFAATAERIRAIKVYVPRQLKDCHCGGSWPAPDKLVSGTDGKGRDVTSHASKQNYMYRCKRFADKEYVAYRRGRCRLRSHLGRAVNLSTGSVLSPVKDWLFVHTEYIASDYLEDFIECHMTIVDTVEEADLCWPNCSPEGWFARWPGQARGDFDPRTRRMNDGSSNRFFYGAELTVRQGSIAKFRGCPHISFNVELTGRCPRNSASLDDDVRNDSKYGKGARHGTARHGSSKPPTSRITTTDPEELLGTGGREEFRCEVTVPYFHSISPPSSGTFENAPWDLGLERPVLVGFYGSIHRHAARAAWHASALAFLKSGNRTSPAHERVYEAPLQDKALHENIHQQFYSSFLAGPAATKDDPVGKSRFEEAWETYATSKFCYQPYGDSPTRRAFWDCWMFGGIPIITESCEPHIQRLFGGTFWGVDGIAKVSLRDVVVVVRDDELGASVLAKAMNMVSGEVERRQRDVRRLAPYFHWNANTNTSAIRMWFAAVLGERPPATVAQLRARGRALSTPQP